jgi:hypothetical protein
MDEERLIAEYLESNPHRPGADEMRLIYGPSVWAITGYFLGVEGNIAETAHAYRVPEDAVRAAIAYYRRNKTIIDNRIAANLV